MWRMKVFRVRRMFVKWVVEKEEKKVVVLVVGLEWDSDDEEYEELELIEVIWLMMLFDFVGGVVDVLVGIFK